VPICNSSPYPGAVHSFTKPEAGNDPSKGQAYNEAADKGSWESDEGVLRHGIQVGQQTTSHDRECHCGRESGSLEVRYPHAHTAARSSTESAALVFAEIVCHAPGGMRIASPGPPRAPRPSISITPVPSRMKYNSSLRPVVVPLRRRPRPARPLPRAIGSPPAHWRDRECCEWLKPSFVVNGVCSAKLANDSWRHACRASGPKRKPEGAHFPGASIQFSVSSIQ